MKIVSHNSECLIIQHYPVMNWLFFIVMILFAVIGVWNANGSDEEILNWVGLIVVTIGFITYLFSGLNSNLRGTVWNFDKLSRKLFIEHRFFGHIVEEQYPIQEIVKAKVDSTGHGLYGIKLFLTDNTELVLCQDYSLPINVAEDGVDKISSFLDRG